jgi:hypothetical protein
MAYTDIDVLYGIQYKDINVYYLYYCTTHKLRFDENHLRRFSEMDSRSHR